MKRFSLGAFEVGHMLLGLGWLGAAFISDSTIGTPLAATSGQIHLSPLKLLPLAALSSGFFLILSNPRVKLFRLAKPPVLVFVLVAYAAWAAGASALSPTPEVAVLRWLQGAVPVAVVLLLSGIKVAPPLVGAVGIAAAAHVVTALFIAPNSAMMGTGVARLGGLLHPALFGVVAALAAVVSCWCTLRTVRKSYRLLNASLLVLSLVGVAQARGIAGIVGAVGGLSLMLLLIQKDRVPGFRIIRSAAFPIFMVAVFVASIGGHRVVYWTTGGRSENILNVTGRTRLWTVVWDRALDRPFVGWGPGALRTGDYAQQIQAQFGGGFGGDAHNALVEAALTTGIIGAALWMAVLAILAHNIMRSNHPSRPLHAALLVVLGTAGISQSGLAWFGISWYALLALVAAQCTGCSPTLLRPRRGRPKWVSNSHPS